MKELFIFPLNNNDYIDYNILSKIEDKEFKYLTNDEIKVLLSWINQRIIDKLPKELETLEGCCGYAADLLDILLKKLNIKHHSININYLLKEDNLIHVITIISILDNNNNYQKYILDPTFRQFLQSNKCLPNKKNKVIYPGYFLSLSKEKKEFGTKLLNNGYFAFNENNLKIYCDAFKNYKNTCHFRNINYNIEHKQNYIKEIYNCLPHQIYQFEDSIKKELQQTPKQLKLVQK